MSGFKNDILKHIKATYFIGVGGIGMSALARFFNYSGILTEGYDKAASAITDELIKEGINIHFQDDINLISKEISEHSKEDVLIIYTPAVSLDHKELTHFRNSGYTVLKRSEVLGLIANNYKCIAVAGTHGKTSVSTIIAHIFKYAELNFNGFLGGISKNYNSNLILSPKPEKAEFSVTEADEFDRSFLSLRPYSAVVTSIDEDHLDIYKDIHDLRETFEKFIGQINKTGHLVVKKNLKISKDYFPENVYTYSFDKRADFYAVNIDTDFRNSKFDIVSPFGKIRDVEINIPGDVNIENVVAASAISKLHGIDDDTLKEALKTWEGVKRRFEYIVNTPEVIYIDDYAHHPEELKSFINSVKSIYKDKKITGIFQPHLYSRTRDFAEDFAKSLSLLDELILLDIYPAREEPIPGVTSRIIFDKVSLENKLLLKKEELLDNIHIEDTGILLTIGAGDIDRYVDSIKKMVLRI